MNNTTLYIRFICLLSLFSFFSCTDDYKENYLANTPIYMSYEDLRSSVRFESGTRSINKPGRIYFKGDTLFIVENFAGVHVLKVDNPAKPEQTGFITIPGCTDLSIRNNILYANSYVDLVGIDVSNLSEIKEVARKTEAFSYAIPERENEHPVADIDSKKGIVINWEVQRISRDIEQSQNWHYYPSYDKDGWDGAYLNSNSPSSGGSSGGASFGTAGSMATFGLYDRYLYVLNNYYTISVYDVNSSSQIEMINSISTQAQAETMFLYDGHMFLGTTTGVNVFSLKAPSSPTSIARYNHLTACDPVVIRDGYAYYTLRGGNACRNDINRLDILKLSSDYLTNELIATYGMTEPYGLGIDNNILFVCDGPAGLKVYDVTDKTRLTENLLASFPLIHAYDVIPMKGYLFTIGPGGFYLYDYTDIKNIKELATIPVSFLCEVME